MSYDGSWTTWNELRFIGGLGSFCAKTKTIRRELLKKYVKSAKLRTEWFGINKAACLSAAQTEIDATGG